MKPFLLTLLRLYFCQQILTILLKQGNKVVIWNHIFFFHNSYPQISTIVHCIIQQRTKIQIIAWIMNSGLAAGPWLKIICIHCFFCMRFASRVCPLYRCVLDVCKGRFWYKSRNYKLTVICTLVNRLFCSAKAIMYMNLTTFSSF